MQVIRALTSAAGQRAGAGLAALAALVLCYAVMLATAVTAEPWPFFAAAAASFVLDASFARKSPYLARLLSRNRLGLAFRFLVRELLLVVLVLTTTGPPGWLVGLLLGAVVWIHLARAWYAHLVRKARLRSAPPLRWRNLEVPGLGPRPATFVPPAPPVFGRNGVRLILHLDLLAFVGAALAVGPGLDLALPALLLLLVLASSLLAWAAWARLRRARRGPARQEMHASVLAAVEQLKPEVVVYFSNPNSATYALNVWLPIVEKIKQPTLIVVRESAHLHNLTETGTPVVVLPRDADVRRLPTVTVQAVLYPTNVIRNNVMLNRQGLRHAFINHGDSDKLSSYNPVCRVFDEIWVAGQAGRERYLGSGEGIREEQIHVVGRPQLAEITRIDEPADLDEEPVLTVLYAPTWEGFFDDSDYSSLERMGVRLLRLLIESPTPVRLLFKPHPATGTRRASAGAALTAAERLVMSAPGGHRVVEPGPDSLYSAFNEADVLISDVSSVITDFLASHKPYIATNPRGQDAGDFHAAYPATRGGYLLSPDCVGLDGFLDDIAGEDRLRPEREQLAAHLLGDDGEDPVERFLHAVDGIVDRNRVLVRASVAVADPSADGMFAEPEVESSDDARDAGASAGGDDDVSPVDSTAAQDPDGAPLVVEAAVPERVAGRSGAPSLGPIGLAVSVVGMLVAAVVPDGWAFLAFAVVGYGFDAYLRRWRPAATLLLSRAGVGITFRVLLRHVLFCVLLLRSAPADDAVVAVLVAGLLMLHLARALTSAMLFLGARRRAFPVGWRNLEVDGLVLPAALPAFLRTDVVRRMLHLDVPVLMAVVAAAEGAASGVVVVAVAVMVLGLLLFFLAAVQQLVVLRRRPRPESVVDEVLHSIERHQPTVAVYFSGSAAATHLLNAWVPVIHALDHRCLVIVRQRAHLRNVATDTVPVLFLPRGADVERFHLPSVRLALYPGTNGKNNHMLRLAGIKDVLIGSGADTHRLVSRVYDEIWVEDDAARSRLLRAGIGVRQDQVREVGWPRLVAVQRATQPAHRGGPLTVLYAPTSRGTTDNDRSSVASMGRRIIEDLLSSSTMVRILFRPHPSTRTRRSSLGQTVADLEELLHRAGGPHEVIFPSQAVDQALNEADLIITDISSLVTDCLYADKPYVVTNPRALSDQEMHREHPTTEGGHLLPPDCTGLDAIVADAREVDSLRERRHLVAASLFGELTDDTTERFKLAVTDLAGNPRAFP